MVMSLVQFKLTLCHGCCLSAMLYDVQRAKVQEKLAECVGNEAAQMLMSLLQFRT